MERKGKQVQQNGFINLSAMLRLAAFGMDPTEPSPIKQ